MGELTPMAPSPDTLQYYLERRNGAKRAYVFDYSKSKTCDHPEMVALARGGIVYRCTSCNYAFHITGAYQQPLHNEVIMAAFVLMNLSKEFGKDAVGEVLRRPIGQVDGSAHKPVLPEGMSFLDVLEALEGIDVTTEDRGKGALAALVGSLWEGHGDNNKALPGDRVES